MTPRTRRPVLLPAALALVALVATLAGQAPAHAQPADRANGQGGGQWSPAWVDRPTGTAEQFRGLAPVGRRVAWVSGTNGTVLRTKDGGATWDDVSPGTVDGFDTTTLQFRDVEAWDSRRAVILSIGTGADSRIYRTRDGGATWRTTFVNAEATAF